MSNCNDSRDTAYQAGYKDGYQMAKSKAAYFEFPVCHKDCRDYEWGDRCSGCIRYRRNGDYYEPKVVE